MALDQSAEDSHEKSNHSRMPGLRRHTRACRPCGGRLTQGAGSRSGGGPRQAWRTHGPGERQDAGQESLLSQALGREGLEGSSGSRELSRETVRWQLTQARCTSKPYPRPACPSAVPVHPWTGVVNRFAVGSNPARGAESRRANPPDQELTPNAESSSGMSCLRYFCSRMDGVKVIPTSSPSGGPAILAPAAESCRPRPGKCRAPPLLNLSRLVIGGPLGQLRKYFPR
jgi:hypothetical protein